MSWYIEQCFKFDSSTVENESSHKAKNLESGLTLLWNRLEFGGMLKVPYVVSI